MTEQDAKDKIQQQDHIPGLGAGMPQASKQNSRKERNCKICIQGLIDDKKMQHVNESDIREYFQGYGTIDCIEIPRDHIT